MPKRTFDMLVPTTPVKILEANPKRLQYSIINNGTDIIYLGGDAGLTVDSGEPSIPGELTSDDKDKEDVWGIAASGNQDIRVTEILEGP